VPGVGPSWPNHPLHARIIDWLMWPFRGVRRQLIPVATGEVLEVGIGSALNLPFYDRIGHLSAVEPDFNMLRRAERRAHSAPFSVAFEQAEAEQLPYASNSFDTVVLTWVLCSARDPERAVAEVLRVLRPTGRLLFAEHVRSEMSVAVSIQHRLTPFWRVVAGGCHLDRASIRLIEGGGFRIGTLREFGPQRWSLFPTQFGYATPR